MNRKMTFFAFPGKCGFFGASGSATVPAPACSLSNACSPTAPNPTPHSLKNQRRVTAWRYRSKMFIGGPPNASRLRLGPLILLHRLFLDHAFVDRHDRRR